MGQRTIITNNAIAVSLLLLLLAGCEEPKTQDDPPTIVWMTVDKNVHFPYYMELDWDILEKINGKELPPIDLGDPLTAKSFSALSSFRGTSLEGKNRLPKDIPSEKLLAFQFNFTVYSYGLRNTTHYDAALHSKLNDCETSSIRREIPEDQMGTFVDDFMQKSFTCLRREIKNVSGKIVFLGSDHGLSFFPLKLAGLSHPPQKIGLVVIDEHTDLYGLKDKGNIPSKANIFGKSLIEGDVGYVLFIGVSPHTKKEFSQSFDPSFTREDLIQRIGVYSDADLDQQGYAPILFREYGRMKGLGIDSLLISIDVDSLPSRYTGFEYSILAPSISRIRNPEQAGSTLAEKKEGFGEGITPEQFALLLGEIQSQAKLFNLTIGSKQHNYSFSGDIEEYLPKQDLGNETSQAISAILEHFP